MKKVLSALLVLIAVFLAYAFAAVSVPVTEGEELGFGRRLGLPFANLQGIGILLLVLGAAALIGTFFLLFLKPRTKKEAVKPSTGLSAKFTAPGSKSKGLEIGFLISGLVAFVILVVMVFGAIKGWFGEAALGALGSVFILQILMGVVFLVMFLKKKDKAIIPFIPALVLFLFEIAVSAFGLVMGLG